jgi:hypothetical protein
MKTLAILSLLILAASTWVGFTDLGDPNDHMNKLSGKIRSLLKWKWLQRRFILTRIGLVVGVVRSDVNNGHQTFHVAASNPA